MNSSLHKNKNGTSHQTIPLPVTHIFSYPYLYTSVTQLNLSCSISTIPLPLPAQSFRWQHFRRTSLQLLSRTARYSEDFPRRHPGLPRGHNGCASTDFQWVATPTPGRGELQVTPCMHDTQEAPQPFSSCDTAGSHAPISLSDIRCILYTWIRDRALRLEA